jgi:hypothetical protein
MMEWTSPVESSKEGCGSKRALSPQPLRMRMMMMKMTTTVTCLSEKDLRRETCAATTKTFVQQ